MRVHGYARADRGPARVLGRRRAARRCCARSSSAGAVARVRGRPATSTSRYGLTGVARFRANYLAQENGAGGGLPHHPGEIVAARGARVCRPSIGRLAELQQGLVLVTGPDRLGQVDDARRDHRPRSTAPTRKPHRDDRGPGRVRAQEPASRSSRSARSAPTPTSFAGALRAAIRQDADVILVGEMRDLETIALAITAAEMGAARLRHAAHQQRAPRRSTASSTPSRPTSRPRCALSLSESLAGVVSQLLLPHRRRQGALRGATRSCCARPGLPNVIREGNTPDDHLDHPVRARRRACRRWTTRCSRSSKAGKITRARRLHEGHRQGALRAAARLSTLLRAAAVRP